MLAGGIARFTERRGVRAAVFGVAAAINGIDLCRKKLGDKNPYAPVFQDLTCRRVTNAGKKAKDFRSFYRDDFLIHLTFGDDDLIDKKSRN